MGGMINKTETGYHQMNRALKVRVEKRTQEYNFPSEKLFLSVIYFQGCLTNNKLNTIHNNKKA
jgi:hypothetical protein